MTSFLTTSSEVLGLVVGGFIIAFTMSVGMGANDVANAFGTTYGAKIMTLVQIVIVASIFEIAGALIIGTQVAETLRKGIVDVNVVAEKFSNSPDCKIINSLSIISTRGFEELQIRCPEMIHMIGAFSSLTGSSIWMIVANIFKLPVSTTHSIVGSMIGFGLTSLKGEGIYWKKLGEIVGSWFLSPVASGIVSSLIWLGIYHLIVKKKKSFNIGLKVLPFVYFVTIFLVSFSIVYNGTPLLYFDQIPLYGVFIICIGLSFIVALLVMFVQVPHLQKKFSRISHTSESSKSSHLAVRMGTRSARESPISSNSDLSKIEDKDEEKSKSKYIEEDSRIAELFKYMQILVACYGSFAHGGNDVSNSVAPLMTIWLIYTQGDISTPTNKDIWLLAYGAIGIVVGLAIWGSRVLKTVGDEITKIVPTMAFSIELGSVLTVVILTRIGLPVSTTHCKIGSLIILGIIKFGIKSVNKKLIFKILLSWFVTVPVSGLISALVFFLINGGIYGF